LVSSGREKVRRDPGEDLERISRKRRVLAADIEKPHQVSLDEALSTVLTGLI